MIPGPCGMIKGRTDQNTGGALLEFSMRTAIHGKSRVSSAIFVCHNQQNFNKGFTPVTVAQWVRRGSSSHRVVHAGGSIPVGDSYQICYSAMIFISVLLGLMDFSYIVILCGRPNSCCQQHLSVLICLIILRFVFMKA